MWRWAHWLTGIINVLFFHVTIPQWIGSAFFIAIIMSVGGGISYLFKRDTAQQPGGH